MSCLGSKFSILEDFSIKTSKCKFIIKKHLNAMHLVVFMLKSVKQFLPKIEYIILKRFFLI